jgi:hypothetical protein
MQGTESDRDEEVRQLAYRLWQEAGCPNGTDVQHWLKAQELWQENHRPKIRTKPSKAKKPGKSRKLQREL